MSEIPPSTWQNDDSRDHDSPSQETADVWQTVFEGVEPGLRAFLRGRLSQPSDVDDCVQAVYVKMIGQARRSDSSVAPVARRAWLFRVAANEAARMWRSKVATDTMLRRRGASEEEQIDQVDPAEKVILTETTEKLGQALLGLPDAWREVVRLRIEQDLTFQQIANQLGIPLGTALTRMRRALDRLRNDIQTDDES